MENRTTLIAWSCVWLMSMAAWAADSGTVRMKHSVLYKKMGYYSGWPLPSLLPDGRLSVVIHTSPMVEHFALGDHGRRG